MGPGLGRLLHAYADDAIYRATLGLVPAFLGDARLYALANACLEDFDPPARALLEGLCALDLPLYRAIDELARYHGHAPEELQRDLYVCCSRFASQLLSAWAALITPAEPVPVGAYRRRGVRPRDV